MDKFTISFSDIGNTPQLRIKGNKPSLLDKLFVGSENNTLDKDDKHFHPKNITMLFDGGSRGNPGIAGSGTVIMDTDKNIIWKNSHFLGKYCTNNQAEYDGLIQGLKYIVANIGNVLNGFMKGVTRLTIEGDSQLVIKQMKNQYRVNNARLQLLNTEANELIEDIKKRIPNITIIFKHIYREHNGIADSLANQAMDNRN